MNRIIRPPTLDGSSSSTVRCIVCHPAKPTIRRQRTHRAFSLVELVLVMTVLATLSAVAVPRFAAFLCNQRLEAAARRMTVDLAYVQERARHGSTTCRVRFNAARDLYAMDGVTNPDHPVDAYVVELGKEPYQVDVTSANLGGDAEIVFDAYGKSDSGGTIVLRSGARTLTVTIDAQSGKASAL